MRYTADELRAMRARGEGQANWAHVEAMTEADLEAAIASDPDWADAPDDWASGPDTRCVIPVNLEPFVLRWFRSQGPDYEARIGGEEGVAEFGGPGRLQQGVAPCGSHTAWAASTAAAPDTIRDG